MPSKPRKAAPRGKRKGPGKAAQDGPPEELLEGDEERRTRAFWTGTISFGLVTIPVELYAATRSTRTSLRMLAPSGTPVSRRYFDDAGKPVDTSELVRGYELDEDQYVEVSDEELEALAPEQSRDIDLSRFVERDAIPPLFFERAYILAPSGSSNLAYRLLASTLERSKRAGIASFVMRGKQYVVAITSEKGLLRAETLRFAEEIRTPEAVGLPAPEEPNPQKVKALRAIIHKGTVSNLPTRDLADSYWKKLETLVERKLKQGEDIVTPAPVEEEEENLAEVIDLVAVLRRSLGQAGKDADEPAANDTKAAAESEPKQTAPTKSAPKKSAPKKSASKKTPAKKSAPKKSAPKKTASKPKKAAPKKRPATTTKAAPKRAAHGR